LGGIAGIKLSTLLQQIINGLSLGSVYALIAVGYSLVYSILSFSNFAHGGFLMVGGYMCYILLTGINITSTFSLAPVGSVWIAGAGALIAAGVVAVLTERLAYKPIRERTPLPLYLLIASMGVSIVIENFFIVSYLGGRARALPHDMFPSGGFDLGWGVTMSSSDLISFVFAVIFLLGLQFFLTRTRWGLAIRAAACDLRTAGLMGINTALLIGIVFFVAGLLAAVGGIFLSYRYSLNPQLGAITIKAFVAAVIGGLGSLPGAVVGSLVLGLAEMLVAGFISSQLRDLVVFSLLVIMLLVKPTGFFGRQISDKI
jgi:branched-chain amino acid transport system permease protein